jgi:hypothetical protein
MRFLPLTAVPDRGKMCPEKGNRGAVMKWKDKPLLNKIAEVLMLLGIIGYFGMTFLKKDGQTVPEALPKFCFAVVWLCLGISYWKANRKLALIYFGLGIGWLVLAALYFFEIYA